MIILYILGYIKYIINVNFVFPYLLKKKQTWLLANLKHTWLVLSFCLVHFMGTALSVSLPGAGGWGLVTGQNLSLTIWVSPAL